MSCITSTSFSILINGSPSPFFKGTRGIKQGCPLSPYLYIMAIEGFSRLIINAKENKLFSGIKVTITQFLTHLLYVDDILIIGDGTLADWKHLKGIIDIFCGTSGMKLAHINRFSLFRVRIN